MAYPDCVGGTFTIYSRFIYVLVCLLVFHFFSGSNRANRRNHFDNEETEILVIPDLEDEGEEDIVSKGRSHADVTKT